MGPEKEKGLGQGIRYRERESIVGGAENNEMCLCQRVSMQIE